MIYCDRPTVETAGTREDEQSGASGKKIAADAAHNVY
jgi:hypothetical protein